MAKGKRWVLMKHFDGAPKPSDLQIQEFDIPAVKDGEILLEIVVLSVDPYMRSMSLLLKAGETMTGETIGKVLKSKDSNFKVGDLVLSRSGWATHFVTRGDDPSTVKIPPFPKGVPISLALGTIGMPGLTAYFGLLEVAEAKPTDTVYVNSAAGAVGSVVGQIAKIKGCRVIGSAGSDEKVNYLKNELGFDHAYNYKKVTPDKLKEELDKAAPKGIDVFFECVGGEASSVVYSHMNKHGRVAVCGTISNYNSTAGNSPKVSEFIQHTIYNGIRIQGFMVFDFYGKREKALKDLIGWVEQGKIKYREHVHSGFDSMYNAFMDLFSGKSNGKVVIKL